MHRSDYQSKKKKPEAVSQESGKRFEDLFNRMLSGGAIYKAIRNGEDFVFIDFNQAAERIENIRRKEVVGQPVSKVFPGVKDFGLLDVLRRVWETGTPEHFPVAFYQDGRIEGWRENYIYRLPSGEIVALYNDVTEQKKMQIELERMMLAVEQADEMIVLTDPDAIIQYVNPAFTRITGYSREEAIGQNPRILKSGKQDAVFYEDLWKVLTSGKTWRGKFINKRKDGSLYNENATISPVLDATGKIVNYMAVKRDVTREVQLEKRLRQAGKMEAIGQLAGGIAHDFNNLLQVIKGYTDVTIQEMPDDAPWHDDLMEVAAAAKRAAELTRQLLAFSRRQVLHPTDLNINEVVDKLRKLIQRLIGENIELDFIPSHELGAVRADRGQIEQILINLCVNARDAMPNGGKIIIETENVLINNAYVQLHPEVQVGRYIMLTVTDTGCGIEKELLDKIFDPFYTTKEEGKGTGMGLATVYGIVKQHKGHINVYSEANKGTAFKIYLPRIERKACEVPPEIPGPVVGGTETILLAEDETSVLSLAVRILEDAGYSVLTAKDGKDAIRVFEEHADKIKLVVIDVIMPVMGGKEAMERILELHPDLPHIFTSGYTDNVVHTNFIQKEGISLIRKPFEPEILLLKVREELDRDKA